MGLTDDVPDAAVADTLRETISQAIGAPSLQEAANGVALRVSEVESSDAVVAVEPSHDGDGHLWRADRHRQRSAARSTPPWPRRRPERLARNGRRRRPPPLVRSRTGIDVILDIELPLVVRFGRTELPLRALARLGPGSLIDLGRSADDPVDVLVSNRVVARGEVVVVGGNYGVRDARRGQPARSGPLDGGIGMQMGWILTPEGQLGRGQCGRRSAVAAGARACSVAAGAARQAARRARGAAVGGAGALDRHGRRPGFQDVLRQAAPAVAEAADGRRRAPMRAAAIRSAAKRGRPVRSDCRRRADVGRRGAPDAADVARGQRSQHNMPRCAEATCGRWRPALGARLGGGTQLNGMLVLLAVVRRESAVRRGLGRPPARRPDPAGALRAFTAGRAAASPGRDHAGAAGRGAGSHSGVSGLRLGAELQRLGYVSAPIARPRAGRAGRRELSDHVRSGARRPGARRACRPTRCARSGCVPFEARCRPAVLHVICTAPVPRAAFRALAALTGWTAEPYLVDDAVWERALERIRRRRAVGGPAAAPMATTSVRCRACVARRGRAAAA